MATGATTNYGGYFEVTGDASAGTNYAVYGEAGSSSNYYAAYFNGEGTLTASAWTTSDRKFKSNIETIEGLEVIGNLAPKSYTFDQEKYPSIRLSEGKNYGLIAQEVEKVLPELVRDIMHPAKLDKEGNVEYEAFQYKGVNYIGLIPFTIAAIQEQQHIIEEKETRIVQLEKEVEEIKGRLDALGTSSENGSSNITAIDRHEARTSMALMPNPSNDVMTISVDRGTCNSCALVITDLQGKLIINIPLSSSGKQVISKSEIGEGVYLCNLVVDGKYVSVERMVFL